MDVETIGKIRDQNFLEQAIVKLTFSIPKPEGTHRERKGPFSTPFFNTRVVLRISLSKKIKRFRYNITIIRIAITIRIIKQNIHKLRDETRREAQFT